MGVHWGHSSAQPPAGPQARPSHSSWCGCLAAAAARPGAPSLVSLGVWRLLLSHDLRLRRRHSVSVSSADALQGCGFSFLLEKSAIEQGPQVRAGVGAALPAITRHDSFNSHPSSTAARAAPASAARALGAGQLSPRHCPPDQVCLSTGRLYPQPPPWCPPQSRFHTGPKRPS